MTSQNKDKKDDWEETWVEVGGTAGRSSSGAGAVV